MNSELCNQSFELSNLDHTEDNNIDELYVILSMETNNVANVIGSSTI